MLLSLQLIAAVIAATRSSSETFNLNVSVVPCVLDPLLPSNLTQHASVQPLCAGFLDVTQPPYSALGDGVTDDTTPIQRALDDAYAYRLVVILPANRTYLVTAQVRNCTVLRMLILHIRCIYW